MFKFTGEKRKNDFFEIIYFYENIWLQTVLRTVISFLAEGKGEVKRRTEIEYGNFYFFEHTHGWEEQISRDLWYFCLTVGKNKENFLKIISVSELLSFLFFLVFSFHIRQMDSFCNRYASFGKPQSSICVFDGFLYVYFSRELVLYHR